MRVWLDDVRAAPPGWVRTTTVAQTVALLRRGGVAEVSLDYDLNYTDGGHKGIEVLRWMLDERRRNPLWRRPVIHVHTANPRGGQEMATLWRTIEMLENS